VRAASADSMFVRMQNTATKTARRPRRSRAEWVAEVRQWRASGLSSVQYASQRGLKSGTLLWWWSRRVGTASDNRPQAQGAAARVPFVPVRVRQDSPDTRTPVRAAGSIEVILSNGRRVRAIGEVDTTDLARVLDAAEGGPGC
jgi:hypothetical protein